MATSTLIIRADTSAAVLDLLKADKLMGLALAIADDNVRADIEIYAASVMVDGERYFDTTKLHPDVEPQDMPQLRRALDYIDTRGDAFPWLMKRRIDSPHLVQFTDKEGGNG